MMRAAGPRHSLPAMESSRLEPRSATRLRERYGLLLAAIVATFAVQGISTPGSVEQIAVSALSSATLLLALWATDSKPRIVRPAFALAILVMIASVIQVIDGETDGTAARASDALLVALAPPVIVIGLIRDVRARQTVTIQAVLGVLCVYLLIGMFFAFVYGTIGRAGDASFFAGSPPSSVANCLYYSFTTLTTVGYGDLTARSNLGHTLSVSEALLGQIYLVTVVSLLVANLGRGRRAAP
jgi:Ion channel